MPPQRNRNGRFTSISRHYDRFVLVPGISRAAYDWPYVVDTRCISELSLDVTIVLGEVF
jgi:hypothetical protein